MTEVLGVKLYYPQEAAKVLGIGRNKIYDLIRNKEIEYVDFGSTKRLTDQAVKNYIERNTVRPERPKLYSKQ